MIPPMGRYPVTKKDGLAILQVHSTNAYLVIYEFLEPILHGPIPFALSRLGPEIPRIRGMAADAERHAVVLLMMARARCER